MQYRPPDRLHPRRPRLVPVPRRRGPGALRGQGQVAAPPPAQLLAGPGQAPAADGPDGGPGRPRRVDRGRQRGRGAHPRVHPHQAHQPRFNVRLKDDKSYPWLAVTLNEEWPRPAVVRGRKRKGVRYFGPYAHADAIRETLDLLLRSFPVRTCSDTKFTRHQRLGRPCLLYDIERCSGPCVGAVDHEAYDGYVERPDGVPRRRHRAGPGPARGRDAGRLRGARVRAGGAAARPHRRGAQGDRDASRWCRTGRRTSTSSASPRTRSRRRCRSSTCAGAASSGHRGFVVDKVEDLSGARVHGARSSRRCTARRGRRCPGGCSCPRSPPTSTLLQSWLRDVRRRSRRHRRAPAGRQAGAAGDGDADGRARTSPATGCAGPRDHNARSKALTELQATLVAARGAAADRVLRHEPPAGHRLRRVDGRARGRPAQALRLPALQGQDACPATTTTPPWRRC